jgi:hypothetical protein
LQLKNEEIDCFWSIVRMIQSQKLKQEDEFLLIDFLITKNEEFKRITTFEKWTHWFQNTNKIEAIFR